MRRVAALLVMTGLLAGCDTSNYEFKADKSIKIVEPKARAQVGLPVTVRWTDSKPPASPRVDPRDPQAQYFAVFVDRATLGPGKRLSSLIDDKVVCRPQDGCPTTQQLADLRVYLVPTPSLVLDFVRDLRASERGDSKDVHEVAVVRMRGDKRIGESAFLQTFFVRR